MADYIVEVEDPKHGKVKLLRTPVEFSETPAVVDKPGPELGQHTEEVLHGIGYSQEKIEELREQGVIR